MATEQDLAQASDPTTPIATLTALVERAATLSEQERHRLQMVLMSNPQMSGDAIRKMIYHWDTANGFDPWNRYLVDELGALSQNPGLDLLFLENPTFLRDMPSNAYKKPSLWLQLAEHVTYWWDDHWTEHDVALLTEGLKSTPFSKTPPGSWRRYGSYGTVHNNWLFLDLRKAVAAAVKRRGLGDAHQGASYIVVLDKAWRHVRAGRELQPSERGPGSGRLRYPEIPTGLVALARRFSLWQ